MSMVGFPLLLIPLAIYNIIVFLMPGVSLTDALVTVPLISTAEWPVSLSDILLTLGIFLLLLEIIKGARPGAKYLTDHLLSLIIFAAAAAEFLLWPKFGTSTYFLLILLTLVDFLTGVALRTRHRRQLAPAAEVPVGRTVPVERAPTPASEPHIEPASSPAGGAPAEVLPAQVLPAQVLPAHVLPPHVLPAEASSPVPKPAADTPSPQDVTSPGLQPVDGSPRQPPDEPRR
jgi:hypothetical protein